MDITIELSEKSIRNAIKQVERYEAELERKVEVYLERLAQAGVEVARATVASVTEEDLGGCSVNTVKETDNGIAIVLSGSKAAFIEFGAGFTYSNPQHPLKDKVGMGVGTYPGQTHAFDKRGWWYGNGKHSYGNRVYAPLYNAELEVVEKARSIAAEVFGS